MFASVRSATLLGVQGLATVVEVHVGPGLPGFQIVGLPDEACRESRDRARAAVLSSGLAWPSAKITINLVPASQRKGGSGLDLAIAVGVLAAAELVPVAALDNLGFIGELGLDGSVRPVAGVAPMVAAMADVRPVVAAPSWAEAAAVVGDRALVVGNLAELIEILNDRAAWPDIDRPLSPGPDRPHADLADVRGQRVARTALEVAAAGGHHLLMVGPPGSGKTMLAERLAGVLPELDPTTSLEATMIHSAIGARLPSGGVVRFPPFFAPHHTCSPVSLVGGGSSRLRPGLVSMSHGGVLFLDELGEFAAPVLDALRQPIESGTISIDRAHLHAELPARFLLVAATNPCPCGGGAPGQCRCDDAARARYLRRLSGPLLDRFDLRVDVQRPSIDELMSTDGGESSAAVARRVQAVRDRSIGVRGTLNGSISADDLERFVPLDAAAWAVLHAELSAGRLSARGLHRVRRVARTVADLAALTTGDVDRPVSAEAVATALTMRVDIGRVSGVAA